ncbi:MAG: hypothetical protein M1824_001084 [Vezdaea acicularis]|nr:MAG: hypothetical protein M1824_001084 [Vezdaea acicularis]
MELGINTWLQIRHTPHEITLLEHRDAYRALSTYAPRMSENSPVLIAFIGYRSKAYMLDHIWGIERAGQDSHKSVRLYSDTTETPHSLPVVLLDCEIHNIKTAYRPESRIDGGEIVRRPLIWPDHHGPVINTEGIAFNLYARALAPLVNVFCLFAADLGGLKGIARRLVRWIALPAASDAPTAILPRLQVVVETASTSFDSKTMKNKLFSYMLDELRLAYGRADEEQLQCDLDRHFQHLSIMPVDKRQRQGAKLTLYHKLQSQLNAECADLQKVRKAQGFSFRAHHHQTYMSLLLDHFCATNLESFSFLQAARLHNPLSNSLQTHIQELLMLQRSEHFLTECFVILVAVALVLDSFPPGSHQFPPTMLFDRFYRDTCIAAISQYNGTAPKSVSLITLQIRAFNSLFENFKLYSKELTKSCMSVVQLHRNKVIGLQTQLQDLKSHTTCFNCLMRMPEKSLSCGHALCNHCIRVFGTPLKNKPFFYLLNRCLLCGKINKSGEFRYQPPTAGIRVLCIDGGGIRGIIPIVFLQSIEERLGLAIPIQDHFDQVVGTSAGGLVVLGLFLKKWTLEECKEKFEIFASKAFERRKMSTIPILSSMPNLVRTYFADSVYKTTAIEAAFQSAFAPSQGMFNPITSDINVAVTATTAGKTMQCIFTNYNGPMPPSQSSGYNLIRAQCPNDDVSIQDAARCTSAAPFFFQAKSLKSLGTFQDGGLLHHNNPVKLALWESKRLRGSDCSYDFVLSLGTGTSDSPAETKQYYPGSPVKDGFCSRLFRSYMASLDG